MVDDRAYEGGRLAGLAADIRDWFRGNAARANARRGFLRPAPGAKRAVWIKSDGREITGWLAAEIARSVRERRADLPIVVTFEHEHRGVEARLAAVPNLAYGFGPADRPRATRRVIERLRPGIVIALGTALRTRLAAALTEAAVPCLVVHGPPPPSSAPACLGFAHTAGEQRAWHGREHWDAPLLALLVAAQVEPVFQGLAGAHARALFWVADPSETVAAEIAQRWRASPAARHDILFLGAPSPGASRLSAWDQDRRPLAPGAVVWVDEPRFWPALAASCAAIHLMAPSEPLLWAALAGGRVVSAEDVAGLELLGAAPLIEVAWGELGRFWQELLDGPQAARTAADDVRRYFWQERRRAADAALVLLERVCVC
ncbi:MAG: glycosyltransferase N-terminal domain-containing protein [Acidiferrobacter sp.]